MARFLPCTKCNEPSTDGNLRRGLCKRCYATTQRRDGYQSTYVDAAPVREHLLALQAAGVGFRRTAELSGLARSVVRGLIHGKPGPGRAGLPYTKVSRKTADAILGIQIPSATVLPFAVRAGKRVPALGTQRRLRALVASGWTMTALAESIGWTVHNIWGVILRQDQVNASTAREVIELFNALQMTPGPSERARRYGQRHGWELPMFWDEDTIDLPETEPWKPTRPIRVSFLEDYLDMRDVLGLSDERIAEKMGIAWASLLQQKGRYRDELAAADEREDRAS